MEDKKVLHSIIRVGKLKKTNLVGANKHNKRRMSVPNSNESLPLRERIESIDLFDDNKQCETLKSAIDRKLAEYEIFNVRKDAVYAIEIVLTASPKFFCFNRTHLYSKENRDDLAFDNWRQLSINWLKDKFKDDLLQAQLHLDESTPHIHAFIFPKVQKPIRSKRTNTEIAASIEPVSKMEYRLCAKDIVTMRWLYELHDSYSEAMKPLNLVRGKRHSQSKHEDLQTYNITAEKIESMNREISEKKAELESLITQVNSQFDECKKLETTNDRIKHSNGKGIQQNKQISEQNKTLKELKRRLTVEKEELDKSFQADCANLNSIKAELNEVESKFENGSNKLLNFEKEYEQHFVLLKDIKIFQENIASKIETIALFLKDVPLPKIIEDGIRHDIDNVMKKHEQFFAKKQKSSIHSNRVYKSITSRRPATGLNTPDLSRGR